MSIETEDIQRWEYKREQLQVQMRNEEQRASEHSRRVQQLQNRYDRSVKTFEECKREVVGLMGKEKLKPQFSVMAVEQQLKTLRARRKVTQEALSAVKSEQDKLTQSLQQIKKEKTRLEMVTERLDLIERSRAQRSELQQFEATLEQKVSRLRVSSFDKLSSKENEDIREEQAIDKDESAESTVQPQLAQPQVAVGSFQGAFTFNSSDSKGQGSGSRNSSNKDSSRSENEIEAVGGGRSTMAYQITPGDFADRIHEMSTWQNISEQGIEFSYSLPSGESLRVKLSNDATRGLSVKIQPRSARERFSVMQQKKDIAEALSNAGIKVHTLEIGLSTEAKAEMRKGMYARV